jgi:thioredoxin reductase (NADPH)
MSPIREGVVVIGRRLEAEDHRLRDFLTRSAQPYEWFDAATPEGRRRATEHGLAPDDLPAVLEGGRVVAAPASVERLAEAWELRHAPRLDSYDVVIVGAGPAGLAAAVYAASDGLSTLLVERDLPGGQASHTSLIENFFGFPGGIGGAEIARLAGRQAEGFGAELILLDGVTSSWAEGDAAFCVVVAERHRVRARTMIAAPGMQWRRLEIDGLDDLLGRGVYYGAGRSEAAQCCNDAVVVVGAGNSAGQAVMNLAAAGAAVTMLVRGDDLGKSMSAYLIERIGQQANVDVRFRTEVAGVERDADRLTAVRTSTGDVLPARALFLCLGGAPRTAWAPEHGVRLDARGFILSGPDLLVEGRRPDGWPLPRDPFPVETSAPGLFAAGDVRHGSTKRVAGAVGDGAMAVALAHRRLEELA